MILRHGKRTLNLEEVRVVNKGHITCHIQREDDIAPRVGGNTGGNGFRQRAVANPLVIRGDELHLVRSGSKVQRQGVAVRYVGVVLVPRRFACANESIITGQVETRRSGIGCTGRILRLRFNARAIGGPCSADLTPTVVQREAVECAVGHGQVNGLIPFVSPVSSRSRAIQADENEVGERVGNSSGIDIGLTGYGRHNVRPAVRIGTIVIIVHHELGIGLCPVRVGHEVQGSVGPNHHAHYKHEAQRYNLSHM